jgi:hypothetical protein
LPSSLALILAGRAAWEEHIYKHGRDEGFDKGDFNAHIELFHLWCIEVHQGQVEETRFSLAPDNRELPESNAYLHCNHIMPSLEAGSTIPPSAMDTASLLQSLTAGITHTIEATKNQNKIQCKQLNYIKEKDTKKKNKAEKWHPTSQPLVLNAASIDSNTPAKEIPTSYLCIINSNTTGIADKELQNQMSELGFSEAGFAHGLATSINMGNILWNNCITPSNLSPFTVYKLALSWQCRWHVASTSTSYPRTPRRNLLTRSRPCKFRR